ncbi:MAG TPA: dihydrodipicolinate synthase family protein [Chloroflexota bacterium]|nr:dihydrodipicolinate synthase family protein [Chloroflexota bacterium]
MAEYTRQEAREWAREHMRGVCGCMMPTFNSSLTAINERAIRHDIRLEKEYGFWGTLLVSECGTTNAEMRQVVDIAIDEAKKIGLRTVMQASFPTLRDTIEMVQYAESAGADLVLLSYPMTFFPRSEQEVYDFTRLVAESTNLGIMLFAIHYWGFDRFHPSSFSPALIGRLIDDVPNIVAVKAEIGAPGVAGIAEIFHRYRDRVIVCDPFERNAPAWIITFGMQFMGTSNYEYMGGEVVKYFNLLQEGRYDEGMQLYWRLHPARQAWAQIQASISGAGLVHRMVWKYQYWLNGFNGGPIRQPHMRLSESQMRLLRQGLLRSGITPAPGEDADFYVGRNPME